MRGRRRRRRCGAEGRLFLHRPLTPASLRSARSAEGRTLSPQAGRGESAPFARKIHKRRGGRAGGRLEGGSGTAGGSRRPRSREGVSEPPGASFETRRTCGLALLRACKSRARGANSPLPACGERVSALPKQADAKRSGGEGASPEEAPSRAAASPVESPPPHPRRAQACCLRQPSPRKRGEAGPRLLFGKIHGFLG